MYFLNNGSNPAFTNYLFKNDETSSSSMTVKGIFLKSVVSIMFIMAISIGVWSLHSRGTDIKWYSMGGMLAAIVIGVIISVRQHWAHILVPL